MNFLIIFVFLGVNSAAGISLEEELTLTGKQKGILDKFRGKVENELTERYKTDLYLVHWLRDSKWNLEKTEHRLLENLKWRRDNQVDEIETLDWSDFEEDFPYTTDVYDREGRPTFAFSFGHWNVRDAVVKGQAQRFILYWAKIMEELTAKVRGLQAIGQNVTQANLIVDVRDFSVIQHSCPQCIPVYTGLITMLRNRYPGEIHKANVVNAPRVFQVLMEVLRPAIGEPGDSFKIYGQNKRMWEQALLQDYSKEQLPLEFGGSNVNAWKKNDIR